MAQSGNVKPFIDFALFEQLEKRIGSKKTFEINADDLNDCEQIMLQYAKTKK